MSLLLTHFIYNGAASLLRESLTLGETFYNLSVTSACASRMQIKIVSRVVSFISLIRASSGRQLGGRNNYLPCNNLQINGCFLHSQKTLCTRVEKAACAPQFISIFLDSSTVCSFSLCIIRLESSAVAVPRVQGSVKHNRPKLRARKCFPARFRRLMYVLTSFDS